jgi:hypothetical protein
MYKKILSMVVFTCVVFSEVAAVSVETELTPPVILSYGWPISGGKEKDYYQLDMATPNVIEIGPNATSYPPAEKRGYDRELLDYWHARGKRLVRRCYVTKFDEDGEKVGYCDAEELLTRWTAAMEEYGIDGIAIDEFIKSRSELVSVWVGALRTVRERYPDKLIFCWVAGEGIASQPLLEAIRDYADFCMPEIYYSETQAEGFPEFEFTRFRKAVDMIEGKAPGIAQKTLMGLGAHQGLWDKDPEIDYKQFLEAQVRTIAEDEVLRKLPGIAIYAPYALDSATISHLDEVIQRYYLGKE